VGGRLQCKGQLRLAWRRDSGSYDLDGSGRIMEQGQQMWNVGGGALVEPTFEVGTLGLQG
jgi:hypothetical protein